MLKNQYNIDIVNAPPLHSSSNGQVERFHSTLVEIARVLKIDKKIEDTVELILRATVEYNKSLHSVICEKPVEILHEGPEKRSSGTTSKLAKAQQNTIERCNTKK